MHPRILIAGLAGTLLTTMVAAPVAAAAPSNDDYPGAIAVTFGVPVGPIDTTEATAGADDPSFPECGFTDPVEHSVWFTWTPGAGEAGDVLANTIGSDYDTTLLVMTGVPGSFSLVDCNDDIGPLQSGVFFFAEEGVTYSFLVDTFADTPGGSLVFTVELVPPPIDLTLTVDPVGRRAPDGTAWVSGTITCSRDVAFIGVEVSLRQQAGRAFIDGFGFAEVLDCGAVPTAWTAEVTGNGIYAGGWANAFAFAFACELTCNDAFVDARIRLRGGP